MFKSTQKRPYALFTIVTILLLITLPKAGMIAWVVPILSFIAALGLVLHYQYESPTTFSSLSKQNPWLIVWFAYTMVTLAHLLLIPRLVDWNSPASATNLIDLSKAPVNTPSIVGSWVLFNCYWAITFLTSTLNRKQVLTCLLSITILVVLQAVYGVSIKFFEQTTILGIWPKEHYIHSATGTFVNHNHYANYLALGIPLAVVGIFRLQESSSRRLIPLTLLLSAIFISSCIAALIYSTSRMGLAIGVLGMVITISVLVFKNRAIGTTGKLLTLAILLIFGLMAANFIGLTDILARYERVLGHDMRWNIWPAMFELPISMWILGSGAGTFFDVFLAVHPPWLSKTVYYAHNDYLQFILEHGTIGTTIILCAMYYWVRRKCSFKNMAIERKAALIVVVLMGIHSTVDFNMRIPANAIMFWFCLGLISNNSLQSNQLRKGQRRMKKVTA